MRPQAVVEAPPVGDEDLRLFERGEELGVQELVSELAVERFDVAVLPRAPRFDEQRRDAQVGEPLPDRGGDELGAVVAPDVLGHAVLEEEIGERHEHLVARDAALDNDRQTLAGVLVDHCEQLQGAAVAGVLTDEVVGPDVVAVLGPQPDAGAVGEPQAAALGVPLRDLETFGPPDALDALHVQLPAGHLQQVGDTPVAVAAEGARQTDHGRGQGVLVGTRRGRPPLGRAVLAQRAAGAAFGDVQPLTDCLDAATST